MFDNTGYVYLSNHQQKTFIIRWIKDEIDKDITLKSIIDDDLFRSSLKQISNIEFTVTKERNLFSSDTLAEKLSEDIYGFGADSFNISLKYNKKKLTDTIRDKLFNLINDKAAYKNLKIIGKNDKGIDLIFRSDTILSKITIQQEFEEKTKKVEARAVFNELVSQISK